MTRGDNFRPSEGEHKQGEHNQIGTPLFMPAAWMVSPSATAGHHGEYITLLEAANPL